MIFEKVTNEIKFLETLLTNFRSKVAFGNNIQTGLINTIIMLYESIKYGEFMNGDETPIINSLKKTLDKYRFDVLDARDSGHAEAEYLTLGTIILEKTLNDYKITKNVKEGHTYGMLIKIFPELKDFNKE